VKETFGPPGCRRLLYIGHSGWQKNVGYLSEIARARPDWEFGWIGSGDQADIPGLRALGVRDTSTRETQELVASYDFLITVGRGDANPMTVLEAMSWGLLPFCTPQSGYVDEPGIVNVPLDDLASAIAVLDRWQDAPEAELRGAQQVNRERLRQHYSWERFGERVESTLSATLTPPHRISAGRRLRLAAIAAASPYGPLGSQGRRLAVAAARRKLGQRRSRD
jgi:glycosyltransferase involved in cell wall biosynthesis